MSVYTLHTIIISTVQNIQITILETFDICTSVIPYNIIIDRYIFILFTLFRHKKKKLFNSINHIIISNR